MLAVADDLTGAHGLGGRWAGRGVPVRVARRAEALRGAQGDRILSVETRFLAPDEARRRSRAGWAALPAGLLRFQKIDSTLRGNPFEEIEGLLMESAAPWVAVLPAYPELGRQVIGGALLVHGRRLDRTEYARDPLSPARGWRVPDLFPRGLRAHAPLAMVAAGTAGLRRWIRRARARGARFLTFDCATTPHVAVIAAACLAEGGRHYAGAADLGGALAQRLRGPARPARLPEGLPWAVVAGTVSASSFRQLAALRDAGAASWSPRLDTQPDGTLGPCWDLAKLRRGLRRSGAVALSSLAGRGQLKAWQRQQARRGIGAAQAGQGAIQALVRGARSLSPRLDACGWFLTGGHTLAAFFDAAGLEQVDIAGEVLREAPLGRAQGPGGWAWVCSKPGGFGDASFFLRFMEAR